MTSSDRSMGDRSRDEVLAGEYVLGVLSSDDRRKVEARMLRDRNFAAIVYRWQENLSTFSDDDDASRQPPARLRPRIERRSRVTGNLVAARRGGLWNSLVFWRGLTLVAVAAAAGFALVDADLFAPSRGRQLVAAMSGEGNAVSLVARYDAAGGRLQVTPVAAGKPEEKSLELWLIKGEEPAQSLGILPQTGEGEIVVPENMRQRLGAGVVLAVSVEPFGGSTTGKVTGPVIAKGPAQVE
ncbi:anti-sigma factor [Metarhizobium album]|uniref:Regulator of SigK n=1 Tax=Metarhizobium album TaxID=2182425 RepID=A0A2U2DRZ2_9HYPH|nr:anti-sigma factor [Rhizobium album]PWE55989.1 anti-sigma factor [Rhizobium album]